MKIQKFTKKRMSNAAHFHFVKKWTTALLAEEWSETKMTEAVTNFKSLYMVEAELYRESINTEKTEAINAADKARDKEYTIMKTIVSAWSGSDHEAQDKAATAIQSVLKEYELKPAENRNNESAKMSQIIKKLTQEDLLAHMKTLGLEPCLNAMILANNDVERMLSEREAEVASREKGALKNARLACDKAYDATADLIDSYVNTADDPVPYQTFIANWNVYLENLKTELKRVTTLRKNKTTDSDVPATEEPVASEDPVNEPVESEVTE